MNPWVALARSVAGSAVEGLFTIFFLRKKTAVRTLGCTEFGVGQTQSSLSLLEKAGCCKNSCVWARTHESQKPTHATLARTHAQALLRAFHASLHELCTEFEDVVASALPRPSLVSPGRAAGLDQHTHSQRRAQGAVAATWH